MLRKKTPYGINFDYKIIPTSRDIPQGKHKNYSGFSFIEGILAVFIISTGMIAVLSLMSSGLKESMDSRDQIIAVLLSQEGIELVRNLRDNNWANDRDTFDNTNSGFPTNDNENCRIQLGLGFATKAIDCNNSNNYTLNFKSYYDYGTFGATLTKFKRRIGISYDNGVSATATNATITSAVTWNNTDPPQSPDASNCNSGNKCAYTQTTLTRWGGN